MGRAVGTPAAVCEGAAGPCCERSAVIAAMATVVRRRTAARDCRWNVRADALAAASVGRTTAKHDPMATPIATAAPRKLARTFTIRVEKEHLKFSAAHFLIFDDGTAERLHGHNYRVAVELEAAALAHGVIVDFRVVKELLAAILLPLDERFLVPDRHPTLTWQRDGDEITVRFGRRRYVVPADEVAVLPVANTSSECLAEHIAMSLLAGLRRAVPGARWSRIEVGVEETAGQRGLCTLRP